MQGETPHYPYQAPIEAYGPAGFRFAGMSHQGSILCLPSGIFAWRPSCLEDVVPQDLQLLIADADKLSLALFGTGPTMRILPADIRAAFQSHAVGVETMDTGAACSTYNILLAEKRPVAALLLLPAVT